MTQPIQIEGQASISPEIFTHTEQQQQQQHESGGISTPATDGASNRTQEHSTELEEFPKPHLDLPPSNLATISYANEKAQPPIKATIVQRGFGNNAALPRCHAYDASQPRIYPVLANEAYASATMHIPVLDHKREKTPLWNGAAWVREKVAVQKVLDYEQRETSKPLIGQAIANKINFGDCDTNMTNNYGACFDMNLDPNAHKEQYIKDIDKNGAAGKIPFGFCRVCKKNHIPWGPPLTLPVRDTCGGSLPSWFPSKAFIQPWKTFNLLTTTVAAQQCKTTAIASKKDKAFVVLARGLDMNARRGEKQY